MPVDLTVLQARRDRTLREHLSKDRGVGKAMELFREKASGYGFRHRRDLLAGALRLNRSMAPTVSAALAECREKSENSGREDANPGEQQSAPTAGRIKI